MAFRIHWPKFSESFKTQAEELLTAALNKREKPPHIVDKIVVKELNMGTKPPELKIVEIGDLIDERFRGIFKFNYSGDAYITVQTHIQANPLSTSMKNTPSFTSPGVLAADIPLTVPMFLRLSDFCLSGILILVFSKGQSVNVAFRNDPVQSVRVSSSFNSIVAIRRFLQAEIEQQLRNVFQEDLPSIIHRLSKSWMNKGRDQEPKQQTQIVDPPGESPFFTSPFPFFSPQLPIHGLAHVHPDQPLMYRYLLYLQQNRPCFPPSSPGNFPSLLSTRCSSWKASVSQEKSALDVLLNEQLTQLALKQEEQTASLFLPQSKSPDFQSEFPTVSTPSSGSERQSLSRTSTQTSTPFAKTRERPPPKRKVIRLSSYKEKLKSLNTSSTKAVSEKKPPSGLFEPKAMEAIEEVFEARAHQTN